MRYDFIAERFPQTHGCYLMLDGGGRVLYVGKAVNLRSRLSSYFRGKPDRTKTAMLVREIQDIDIMILTNENESLTLERELIKHYKPPYNRAMRDGPSVLPYIAVTSESMPRLTGIDIPRFQEAETPAGRQTDEYGSLIGPFPNVPYRNIVLDYIIETFGLPNDEPMDEKFARRFYMELLGSAGEGEGRFSPERLAATLEQAVGLLQNPSELLEHMREQMIGHAEQLRFERAHQIKKHLDAIVRMREKQNVNRPGIKAETVVWIGDAHALIAHLEDGTVRRRFLFVPLPENPEPAHAVVALFAAIWAERKPHEIITNAGGDGIGQQVLAETAASCPRIRLCVPQKGRKRALLDICRLNLEYRTKRRMEES